MTRTDARARTTTALDHVEVGAPDLERSLAFYGDLLGLEVRDDGAGGAWAGPVHLLPVDPGDADDGGAVLANHQSGLRHVGFRAADVDARAARLEAAGVELTIGPLDALGDVRVVFARAPEGTHVELVSGVLRCTTAWDADLAAEHAAATAQPVQGPPVFDHVATTTGDLDALLATWAGAAGLGRLGQVPHPGDERGYVRSYLVSGAGSGSGAGGPVLEVFSYAVPPLPPPAPPGPGRTGLRCAVLRCDDVDAVRAAVLERGGRVLRRPGGAPGVLLGDADGAAWCLLDAAATDTAALDAAALDAAALDAQGAGEAR